jgi:hypothetical protein
MTDRPRVAIVCDGTDGKKNRHRHDPVIVAVYACDTDGTLLPIHSGIRADGRQLVLPSSGLRPDNNQFAWACPRRGCRYQLVAPIPAVTAALLRLGQPEVTLRDVDAELRRHAP